MHRLRWTTVIVVVAASIASGVWGLGVFGQLSEGGYIDPGSESAQAAEVAEEALGAQGGDVIVIYTPDGGNVDDPAAARAITADLAALPADRVESATSYWQLAAAAQAAAGQPQGQQPADPQAAARAAQAAAQAAQFVTPDKRSAIALVTLAGADETEKLENYREIKDDFTVDGVETKVGGAAALQHSTSERSKSDLTLAEGVSLPVVLVLLVLIFGSLVAAALPVLVGGLAVLGALGVLHVIALTTEVNSFAVNVASLLGLGMAIDYGLFMVGRFREELAAGRSTAAAVRNTVATAGRTVAFSATLLIIALAGLMLFPQGFLKSLSYGGMSAVALAAFTSLTLLPAMLGLLGPRVDKLALPRRKKQIEGEKPVVGTGWERLARFVMKRPVLVALPILALLVFLAVPIKDVRFGEIDERVLPSGDPAREALAELKAEFPAMSGTGVQVVLRGADAAAAQPFAAEVANVPGIGEATVSGSQNGVTEITAALESEDALGTASTDAVERIRALDAPAGAEVLVGGFTARNVDSIDATYAQLPRMVLLLAGATLVLMFLAFGSMLLPVKAVVMSALSLTATFGVLVFVFQEGHGAGLLDVTPAPLEIGIVVLMAAVVFGLSTDYEVFLLSRMVEARTRGASTADAVVTGIVRTGRVISAAAILLVVVTGAFALSSLTMMRFIGVGMILALVLDATVVRMLLVPAVIRLMGDAAWWAPGPLRRLQERAGLAETDEIEEEGEGAGLVRTGA
ncbi:MULTISPECIES: MMPL family transporter [Catenuloplanes]|uniref:RND superfamily putative drug exporter n=1 Tax=Catenuloplanes niger TaxID=587534 RepID=A0AAE3ZXJ1_9ACTN|nr:MMPL family transporter [Catenuloplanes niger]MDR7326661.1 RND superfamily putative drug exporter [Catenuloplanes niger]